MTNPRDTGKYDAFTDSYIDTNVRIDFAWGNIPMQPDDDRDTALDPELDSHIIATSGYEGFPAFITGAPYDDTVDNFTVPSVVGLTIVQATSALAPGNLSISEQTSTVGATSQNNNKVKAQNIPAGTVVNSGSAITLTKYNYVTVTTFPISAVTNNDLPGGSAATDAYMYLLGRVNKPTVGWYINIDGNGIDEVNNNNYQVISVVDDDAFNTGGTKVLIRSTTGDLSQSSGWQGNYGTWNQL